MIPRWVIADRDSSRRLAFSRPAVTIQTAVLDGFGNVLGTDRLHAR